MACLLPDLDYAYDALEPHFDARTMELHHTRHHQTYVAKLNSALEEAGAQELFALPIESLLGQLEKVPAAQRAAVRNNAGGHANHSFFWKSLNKQGPKTPVGALAQAIDKDLGGFEAFRQSFTQAALGRFGSGWAWLYQSQKTGTLHVGSTPNQDSPLMTGLVDCEGVPILGVDVWEHAYYLLYQNRRADYLTAFWNVVDWDVANSHYRP